MTRPPCCALATTRARSASRGRSARTPGRRWPRSLERVADDLSATDDQYRAVAVALSGPRSSAVMLAGLPVVGIALGASMGAQPLTFLTARGAGQLRLLCAACCSTSPESCGCAASCGRRSAMTGG